MGGRDKPAVKTGSRMGDGREYEGVDPMRKERSGRTCNVRGVLC